MLIFRLVLFFLCTNQACSLYCLKLDRVILSTNINPNYIEFWPLVAKAWREVVGVQPTLALITDGAVPDDFDWDAGDVLLFEPIEGVPASLYAQCIRNLLPVIFPDDVCILSDIDDIPLQKSYFVKNIVAIPEDHFVVYRSRLYESGEIKIPMTYNAAKGTTFREIFGISTFEEIPGLIKKWNELGWGWCTDERILGEKVFGWKNFKTRCSLLDLPLEMINRAFDSYHDPKKLSQSYYTDYHCPRPYSKYQKLIDSIVYPVFQSVENRKVR